MAVVDPEAVRALAAAVEAQVGPKLQAAFAKLQETREIEHSNFTAVAWPMAVAYVAAVEFTEEQIKSKREHLETIRKNLIVNADAWERADKASIIQVR